MSTGTNRLTSRKAGFFGLVLGLLMALVVLAATPAGAAERPFKLEFNESQIDAGFAGGLDLEALSGPSSIEGTIDDAGNIKIPKGKFLLPVIDASAISQSLAGIDLPVGIQGFMGIEQAATGTFNEDTGQMVIQTKAGLWLTVNVKQLLGSLGGLGVDLPPQISAITGLLGENLTCGFSPMNVTFTTETTSLGQGQRFTQGLAGPGALTAEWSQLGPFAGRTKILFLDPCTLIRGLLPSLISGIGGNALGGIDIGALLAGLDDLDLGPSALTITRVVDVPVPPTPARLNMALAGKKFGPRAIAGRAYRVSVTNSGDEVATGTRICAKASARAVRGDRCIALGSIAPGKSKQASFRLSLARNAPRSAYRVSFRMTSSGSTAVRSVVLTSGR